MSAIFQTLDVPAPAKEHSKTKHYPPAAHWPVLEPNAPAHSAVSPKALTAGQQQVQSLILSIPALSVDPAVARHATGVPPTSVSQSINGVQFAGSDTQMTETSNFSEIVAANPNADAMWPGCLVQTKPLATGDLAPIGVSRGPATLTLTTPFYGTGVIASRTLQQPSLASVQQAVLDMAASTFGSVTPAMLSSSSVVADSLDQGMIDVGVNVKFVQGDIKAKFNMNVSRQTSSVVVKLTQAYYTVALNTPSSPAAVFADSIALSDVTPYMAQGNPPAYVASVTYGRTLLFVFQADVSKTELKASVDALIKGGTVDVSAVVSGQHSSTLKKTQVQVWAVGGAAVDALNLTDPSQLQNYIQRGANFSATSPGLPISCQIRYLRDNSAVTVSAASVWTDHSPLNSPTVTTNVTVGLGPNDGGVRDTGIIILPGDQISITASGIIWSGVWLTGSNGPSGWYTWSKPGQSGFPMMDQHPFSLIGQINNLPFYIGDSYTHTQESDKDPGGLLLLVNSNNLQNGSGHFNVAVTVVRAPR